MRPSRVVPNHSTTRTRPSLTSLFEWEAVTLGDVAVRDGERSDEHQDSARSSIPPLERVCIGGRCTVRPARGQTQQQQMSDDEADEVGAKAADDYADEFADDDDYQFGKTSKKRKIEPLKNPGWCLVVKLTFKGIGGVMKFKDIFEPYADWIKHNEPTTLSYSYSTDDKDPKSVLLFERYADRDTAYLKIHKESDEFKKFRPALAALEPVIDGHSYWETGGFIAREENR